MACEVPPLETPHLLLRAMEEADIPQIQAIFPQWEIVKYLNAKVPAVSRRRRGNILSRTGAAPARKR